MLRVAWLIIINTLVATSLKSIITRKTNMLKIIFIMSLYNFGLLIAAKLSSK